MLNVDNLFPSNTNHSGTNPISIESLFSNDIIISPHNCPNSNFSSDKLIDRIAKKRKKKMRYYANMLTFCYDKIENADKDNLTEIIFEVPEVLPECFEYRPDECLDFIGQKLKQQYFDIFQMAPTMMFISWNEIELRKKQNKENQKSE